MRKLLFFAVVAQLILTAALFEFQGWRLRLLVQEEMLRRYAAPYLTCQDELSRCERQVEEMATVARWNQAQYEDCQLGQRYDLATFLNGETAGKGGER